MKIIRLFICLMSITIIGCSNDVNDPGNKDGGLDFFKMAILNPISQPINGVLSAMYYEQGNYGYNDYYARAAIFQNIDKTQKINAGVATIADNVTSPDNDNEYHNKSAISFGQTVNFGIAGNIPIGIDPFASSMYIPQKIHVTIPGGVIQISKSNGMTITWNSDNNNDKGVFVGLNYLIIESNDVNPNMPDNSIITYENVDDNGSYTITPAKLADYPVGSFIELVAVRGNYKYLTVGSRIYLLLGHASYIYQLEVVN